MSTSKASFNIIIGIIILPFILNWFGYHTFLSSPLSIAVTSVLLTICMLLNLREGMKMNDIIVTGILAIMLWITAIVNHSLGCVLTCYNIFLLSFLFNNLQFEKKKLAIIHLLIVFLLGTFILTLDFKPNYQTYNVFQKNGEEININSFGVLILAFYYHFLILLNSFFKKGIRHFLFLCITPIAIYLIEISACRSAYLSLVVFLILYLNKNFIVNQYKKILFFVVAFAIVFPFIYLQVADKLIGIEFGGKPLLNRQVVWKSTVELIKQYPLLGSGTVHAIKMSLSNLYTDSAHNVFLGLWKTVGIIPMILFAFRLNKGKNMDVITKSNIIKKKMFLCCIVLCIFETLLNDSNTYIFFMTLLLTQKEEENV